MTTSFSNERNSTFPPAIIDAVKESVDKTYAAYCGETPKIVNGNANSIDDTCVAGIISFFGTTPWSLSWLLTRESAPAVAKKFAGFDVPFDSADMGDLAGELVNVLAGEVIAQLERRDIKAQMSLPTVARGAPLELMPESGPNIAVLDFAASQGPFRIRLVSGRGAAGLARVSGA